MNHRILVLVLSVTAIGIVLSLSSGLIVLSANKLSNVVNTTSPVTPTPLVAPKAISNQGVMSITRIVDDPRNFIDVKPHSVGLQIVSKYLALQNAMNEADKRFEEAQVMYKNIPAGARIQLAVQPNYNVKIPADLAHDIVSEPELKFSPLPTPYGQPDLKSYGTSIRVGNAVYSIGISYI